MTSIHSRCAAVFAALALVSGTFPAQAAEEPLEHALGMVDGLLAACTYSGDDQAEIEYHFGNCVGFIRGVRATLEVQAMEHGGHFTCETHVTQNGELSQLVVAELQSGRWKSSDYSTHAIEAALTRAYPCPKTM